MKLFSSLKSIENLKSVRFWSVNLCDLTTIFTSIPTPIGWMTESPVFRWDCVFVGSCRALFRNKRVGFLWDTLSTAAKLKYILSVRRSLLAESKRTFFVCFACTVGTKKTRQDKLRQGHRREVSESQQRSEEAGGPRGWAHVLWPLKLGVYTSSECHSKL